MNLSIINFQITAFFIAALIHMALVPVFAQPPDTVWTYTYASSMSDQAFTIAPTFNGGFVVGGQGQALDRIYGALLIRLDSQGHQAWVRRYTEFSDGINDVIATADGGFAMVGGCPTDHGVAVAKTDSEGTVLWSRCAVNQYLEPGNSIVETTDNGLAILSIGVVLPSSYVWLVRLDSRSNSPQMRTLGDAGSYLGGELRVTADSGFFVAGSVMGSGYHYQALAIKTDSLGNIQWRTTFGSPDLTEYLFAAREAVNGDFVVAGVQARDDWTFNPYVARINSQGDTLWTRAFPDIGPAWTCSVGIFQDNNIVISGRANADYLVILVNPEGDLIWSTHFNSGMDEECYDMCLASDNSIALAGCRHPHLINADDIWVVRSTSLLPENIKPISSLADFRLLRVYPNPFNSTTHIEFTLPATQRVLLRLYDVLGREVAVLMNDMQTAGTHSVRFSGNALSSGVYFCRMEAGNEMRMQKIVLMK